MLKKRNPSIYSFLIILSPVDLLTKNYEVNWTLLRSTISSEFYCTFVIRNTTRFWLFTSVLFVPTVKGKRNLEQKNLQRRLCVCVLSWGVIRPPSLVRFWNHSGSLSLTWPVLSFLLCCCHCRHRGYAAARWKGHHDLRVVLLSCLLWCSEGEQCTPSLHALTLQGPACSSVVTDQGPTWALF